MTITTEIQDQDAAVMTERDRFIDGLRVLAAALEAHPGLPLPNDGSNSLTALNWTFWGDGSREQMALAARALPCAWDKEFIDADPDGRWMAMFRLHGTIGSVHVRLTAQREAVCRRIVTGTREVTEEVPDPAAPKITVTRTVEDVEYDCGTLLGPKAVEGTEGSGTA